MRYLIFILILLLSFNLQAQYNFNGQITLQNSGKKAVSGATIEQKPIGNTTLSDQKGLFSLQLAGKTAGSEVILEIQKDGYEIVNKDDLYLTLTDDQRLAKYYMCLEGEWEQNAIAYLGISKEYLTRRYIEETKRVKQALAGNQALMNDSLATLDQRYQSVLTHAQELAERFALANLDDETDLYNEAFLLFKEGQIQEAIQALTDKKLQAQYDKIKAEVEKGNELVAIGSEKLANAEEAISRGIENYLLKADLLIINFQFEEAGTNYRKAVDADTTRAYVRLRYADFLQDQNFIPKAIKQYQRTIAHINDSSLLGQIYRALGFCYTEQNNYEKAFTSYEQALEIHRILSAAYPLRYQIEMAEVHNNLGTAYSAINNFNKALEEYDNALALFEETKRQSVFRWFYLKADWIKASALMNKALVYNKLNRYEEALNSNKGALDLLKKWNKEDTLSYREELALVYNNQGLFQTELNRYLEAIGSLNKAKKIAEKLARENPRRFHPILGKIYLNEGNTYAELYQQAQAFTAYQKGLTIYRELYKENPDMYGEGLAVMLNGWATLNTRLFIFDKALEAHEEELFLLDKMALKSPEKFTPMISSAYTNIGIALTQLYRTPEAIQAFEKAEQILLDLTPKYPDRYEADLAGVLHNLSQAYNLYHKYDLALKKAQEATKILQILSTKVPEKFLPHLAANKLNLGHIYTNQKALQKAELSFEEAYYIFQKLLVDNRERFAPEVAGTLMTLAHSNQTLEKYVKAQKMYEESLEIMVPLARQNPQRFQNDLGKIYFNYAGLFNDKGNYDSALVIYQKSIDIYTKINSENSNAHFIFIARARLRMGEIHRELYQYDLALKSFQEATNALETLSSQIPNSFKQDLGQVLSNLGITYGDLGMAGKAIEPLNKAITYFTALMEERPSDASFKVKLSAVYNNLGLQYKEVKRHKESVEALQNAIALKRQLYAENPKLYEFDLANSLSNIGATYLDMNQSYLPDAEKANLEALAIYRKLALDSLEEINLVLANSINNQGLIKHKEKKYEEALGYLKEAIDIRKALALENVQKYGLDLVASYLGTLFVYAALENMEEVSRIKHQADSVLKLCPNVARKHRFQEIFRFTEGYDRIGIAENPVESLKAQVSSATSYEGKVLFQTKLIEAMQVHYKDSLTYPHIHRKMANAFADLSWFYLFTGQIRKAGNLNTTIFQIDPKGIYPRAKKAHYLFIEGFYDWAEKTYRQYKDTPYNETKMWKEVFLEDLQKMEDAGIIPDMRMDFLKKVRKILNE